MIKKIGSKIYKNRDQIQFAKTSRDFNKIHTDKVFARKLIFGEQIVHGINILLTALSYLKEKNFKISNICCNFLNPVFLNSKVDFFKTHKNNNIIIHVKIENELKSVFTLSKKTKVNEIKDIRTKKIKKINLKENIKLINNTLDFKSFNLKTNEIKIPKKFSNLLKILNKTQIQEILSISFFVGMICPGKYSLISSIDINLHSGRKTCRDVSFKVKKKDNRFNRFEIHFSNNIYGKVFAFSYKVPSQKKMSFFKKRINKNISLYKKNSLIIGGSRGLGEDTSKILASAGSNIILTYLIGKQDAKKIKNEIESETNVKCKTLKLDLSNNSFLKKIRKLKEIDFLFYFATIKIASNKSFNYELYKKYKRIYCLNFLKICKILNQISNRKINVFFPSTIFINEKHNKYSEYIRAKKDSEKVIKKINKNLKKIKVISVRLPVMNTSQNISIFNQNKPDSQNLLISFISNFVQND
jgi:acyl dehydratase/NADP-dependent 3-hydroxy acid dehydrogenase YdfG